MRKLALIAFALLSVSVLACDQKDLPSGDTSANTSTAEAPEPTAVSLESIAPPAPRMVQPPALRTLRLTDDSVGTITSPQVPTRTLNGIGMAACQTGWVLQGLYFNDDGNLVATNPFELKLANVPTDREIRYEDPKIEGRAIVFRFDAFDYSRVAGTFKVLDTENDDTSLLEMKIDGTPTTLMQAPGLGPMGCFDTGFWKAEADGSNAFGPVTAVYDPANLHFVGARLSPTVNLVFLFTLRDGERGRGDLITTTVEKIREQPDRFPIRIYLERRVTKKAVGDTTGPQIELEELPLESGKLYASFPTGKIGGPMRIQLEDVKMPEWDGPLSNAEIKLFRAETLFVTDTHGEDVPLPEPPEWFERPPVVLP